MNEQKTLFYYRDYLRKYYLSMLFLFLSLFIYSVSFCGGQNLITDRETSVKAAYIYNFTKFVYWNSQDCDAPITPITISVLGADQIYELLSNYVKQQKSGKPIKVQKVNNELKEVSDCQIVFISRADQNQSSVILKHFEGLRILTVSDISGFAHNGGMIGFFFENGRVKIEVNLGAVKKAGFRISAKLLEIARIVSNED